MENNQALGRICAICQETDWQNDNFQAFAAAIMSADPKNLGSVIKHRKLWEFVQTITALQQAGLLTEEARGLSVAAGSERILFYLANHIQRIVATDIYGHGDFINNEADSNFLTSQRPFAPYDYRESHLKALFMDAMQLDFADHTFDFAFSLSSVEHFGSLENTICAVNEMIRVVRPGGLAIVVTECAVNDRWAPEVFTKTDLQAIIAAADAPLYQPVDWSFAMPDAGQFVDMHKDKLDTLPHLYLKKFGSLFTSVSLVFQPAPVEQSPQATSLEEFDTYLAKLAQAKQPFQLPSISGLQKLATKFTLLRCKLDELCNPPFPS